MGKRGSGAIREKTTSVMEERGASAEDPGSKLRKKKRVVGCLGEFSQKKEEPHRESVRFKRRKDALSNEKKALEALPGT